MSYPEGSDMIQVISPEMYTSILPRQEKQWTMQRLKRSGYSDSHPNSHPNQMNYNELPRTINMIFMDIMNCNELLRTILLALQMRLIPLILLGLRGLVTQMVTQKAL